MTKPIDPIEQPAPGDRPMSDQTRQRIRERLARGASPERGAEVGQPRRWSGYAVPAVAAASVAALFAGGMWLAANEPSGGTRESTPMSGASGSPTPGADESPTSTPDDSPTTMGETTMTGPPTNIPPEPKLPCTSLVAAPDEGEGPPIAGARLLAKFPTAATTTYIYGSGSRYFVCDDYASRDGGPGTLFAARDRGAAPSAGQFEISENYREIGSSGQMEGEYVAAGAVPEGVTAIDYRFPGGHVEQATIDGDYWSMVHVKKGGYAPDAAPIEVSLTSGGETTSYTLQWGVDTCAQVNHGC